MKDNARAGFSSTPQMARLRRRQGLRACVGVFLACLLPILMPAVNGDGAAVDPGVQAAAKRMEGKLQVLGSTEPSPTGTYRAVIITEYEADSYMKLHSGEFLPAGVHPPSISVQPDRAVISGDVNFDELSRANPNDSGPKILAAMFHGNQHVTLTGNIQSQASGVLVQIQDVTVGSMTVPHWLLDLVIQNFLQPKYHFDLSKPLPYPDHVTRIVLGSGQTTFLRGPKPSH